MSAKVVPWAAVIKYPTGAMVTYGDVVYVSTYPSMALTPGGAGWVELGTLISTSGAVVDATTTVKGIASFNASDFNVASGAVTVDYTNGQAASASVKGFLTNTDWTTFNAKQPALVATLAPTRAVNTTYTNGSRPTLVVVSFSCTLTSPNGAATAQFKSDSSTPPTTAVTGAVGINDGSNGNIHTFSISTIIAASLKYRLDTVETNGSVALVSWQELTL